MAISEMVVSELKTLENEILRQRKRIGIPTGNL